MNRIPALDGLRGIAILLVLAVHGWGLEGGTLGVDLFFVLSGFLITGLLLAERERTGRISLRRFYRRRTARLLPALTLLLLAHLLVAPLAGASLRRALETTVVGASYTTNLLMTFDPGLVGARLEHLWSLGQEEQFYILWPLLLVALLRCVSRRTIGLVLSLAVASSLLEYALLYATGATRHRLIFGPDTHGSAMLLGCLAAIIYRSGWRMPRAIGLLALAGSAAIVAMLTLDHSTVPAGIPLFALTAAPGVLFAATADGAVARLLALGPLVFLGRISYGLYLWHWPLLAIRLPAVVVVPLAVFVAWESWRLVEAPLLRRYSRSTLDAEVRREIPPDREAVPVAA